MLNPNAQQQTYRRGQAKLQAIVNALSVPVSATTYPECTQCDNGKKPAIRGRGMTCQKCKRPLCGDVI